MKFSVNNKNKWELTLEDLNAQIDKLNDTASLEGLNSNILGRMFVSIVDTFGGLVKTFGSNLFNITKSVKRSELKEFVASNSLKVRTVDHIPFEKLASYAVDTPANLTGTYKNAIDHIAAAYHDIDAINRIKLASMMVNNLLEAVVNDDSKSATLAKETSEQFKAVMKFVVPRVLACQKDFSGTFVKKVNFSALFPSKEDWTYSREALIKLMPYLQDAKTVRETVETIERTLKGLSDAFVTHQSTIDQNSIILFGGAIKNVASLMDGYQVCVMRQLALEHNYVLITNDVYAHVK